MRAAYGLAGVIEADDEHLEFGLLEDELYDLSKTRKPLENLLEMPGGAFGSCRFKLPDLDDEKFYNDLFKRLDKLFIGYFFFNGGNDSADTCLKVAKAAEKFGYDLKAIAIPKTIDNDLAVTDNCPGFGSVAKYVATSAKEASLDIRSMCKTSTKVFVLEVMGRHAGWIAASGELANNANDTFVHKILLPERKFNKENLLTPKILHALLKSLLIYKSLIYNSVEGIPTCTR